MLAYINKKETEQLQETKRKKKNEPKNLVRIEFEILLSETVMEKIRLDVLVVDRTHDEPGQWAEQASTRMLAPSLFEPYDGSLRLHRMLYFRCMSTSTQNLLRRCHECYKGLYEALLFFRLENGGHRGYLADNSISSSMVYCLLTS